MTAHDPARDPAHSFVGQSIGSYQVTGVLGRGGMGVVLRARITYSWGLSDL